MPKYLGLAMVALGFLRTHWPRILQAWTATSAYLSQHPELPAAARLRLEGVRDRLVDARTRKSEEAQIRAMLDVLVSASTTPGTPDGVRRSLAERAERLRQALAVAEQLSGRERRRALARIRATTDLLAAEAIESLLPAEIEPRQPPG
jgi:hypothetical protein